MRDERGRAVRFRSVCTGIFGLLAFVLMLLGGRQQVRAAGMSFVGSSITWSTSGTAGTGGTRYQAVGWRFTVTCRKKKTATASVTYYLGNAKESGYKKSKAITKRQSTKGNEIINVIRVNTKALARDTGIDLKSGWISITADAVIEIYNGQKSLGIYTTKETANAGVSARGFKSDFDHAYKGYFGQKVSMEYFYLDIKGDAGTSSTSPKSGWKKKGSKVRAGMKLKKGYVSDGWDCTKLEDSGEEYDIRDKVSIRSMSCSWVLRAMTHRITYGILFVGTGADSGSMELQTFSYDEEKNLDRNGFVRKGYLFAGWNTRTDGGGRAFGDGQQVCNLSEKDGDLVTLYACWKPITYTIRYSGNGAESGAMADQQAVYDQERSLSPNQFRRKGCRFTGWSTENVGSPTWKNGERVCNLCCGQGQTVLLYAQWERDEPPVIRARDRYVTLDEARLGRITEDFLFAKAGAEDEEDGQIMPGLWEKGFFQLRDHRAESYTALDAGGEIKETFEAGDSAGNVSSRVITVHVVDTRAHMFDKRSRSMRFISSEYVDRERSDGGLSDDSLWRKDPGRAELLRKILCTD